MKIDRKIQLTLEHHQDKVLFAYLFGSLAAGTSGPLSDVDVAVYFAEGGRRSYQSMKIELYVALSRALHVNAVDLVVLNSASNLMLLHNIVQQGIVIVDLDPAFRVAYETNILHQAIDFRQQRKRVMGT